MVPPISRKVPRVSRYSGSCRLTSLFAYAAFTLSGGLSQNPSAKFCQYLTQSITPEDKSSGLGSSPFARRYSGNRCFFLFLRLLRCFSSPGSRHAAMDSRHGRWSLSSGVSPFRNLRVNGYVLLSAAYRSLSRLSSAPSAKASALCSSLLDLFESSVTTVSRGFADSRGQV